MSKAYLKLLRKLVTQAEDNIKGTKLPEDKSIEKMRCEASFYEFFKHCWSSIESGDYTDGWHIKAVCDHMQAVYEGKIRRLVINVPPGSSKSSISIAFLAWVWSKDPSKQFIYASFNIALSRRHSLACLNLIKSDWYQGLWGDKFQLSKESSNQTRFDNNKFGYRLIMSVGGAPTGSHADFLVTDDLNSGNDARSEVMRQAVNDWYSQVWPTRLNDRKTGCFIDIQQRLHENDLTGFIQSLGVEFVHLRLPAEFEKGFPCKTIDLDGSGKVWQDPRTKDKELLWEARVGRKELEELKKILGSYQTAAQLQQRPAPLEGMYIKSTWFGLWKDSEPPQCAYTIQSWDIALTTEEHSCFSACTTWGVFMDDNGINNVVLLSMWKGKEFYPNLRKMAKRLANNYLDTSIDDPYPDAIKNVPDIVLIEDTTASKAIIADLQQGDVHVTKFNPKRWGDKHGRVSVATQLLESGRVWLPALPPDYTKPRRYAADFLKDCILFPNAISRDTVDSMSQALIYIKNQGAVYNAFDKRESDYVDLETDKPFY